MLSTYQRIYSSPGKNSLKHGQPDRQWTQRVVESGVHGDAHYEENEEARRQELVGCHGNPRQLGDINRHVTRLPAAYQLLRHKQ